MAYFENLSQQIAVVEARKASECQSCNTPLEAQPFSFPEKMYFVREGKVLCRTCYLCRLP